jgi:hypothetical protein
MVVSKRGKLRLVYIHSGVEWSVWESIGRKEIINSGIASVGRKKIKIWHPKPYFQPVNSSQTHLMIPHILRNQISVAGER